MNYLAVEVWKKKKKKNPTTENSISVSVEEATKTVDNKHLSLFLHRMGINM